MRLYLDQTLPTDFTKTNFCKLWFKKKKKGIWDLFKHRRLTHYPLPTSSQPTPRYPRDSTSSVFLEPLLLSVTRCPWLSQTTVPLTGSRPLSVAALPDPSPDQVPSILHRAARVIISKKKSDQAIPLFKIFQWLCVAFRIKLKHFSVHTRPSMIWLYKDTPRSLAQPLV